MNLFFFTHHETRNKNNSKYNVKSNQSNFFKPHHFKQRSRLLRTLFRSRPSFCPPLAATLPPPELYLVSPSASVKMNTVPTRGLRGFWFIVPPTIQQINYKAAEVDATLEDVKTDLRPIRVVHGTPKLNNTAPSSITVASLQSILETGTQIQDEISNDIQKRADAPTKMATMEEDLGGALREAKDKWEHARSMADAFWSARLG